MKAINKTQQGFTLVELIIVIVILGILAVTAAPRFLNFQGDAKASVLEGIAGSLKSGLKIVEGKAIISGLNAAAIACFNSTTNTVVPASGDPLECTAPALPLNFGSPALNVDSVKAIAEFSGDIAVVIEPTTTSGGTTTAGTKIFIANNATDAAATGCRVVYTPATATTTPASVVVESGTCN
jgi:prepilin-type N-terminal cleavage/methylation domain-containing protein